jgi:hemolysin activation/secretion protein
LRDSLFFGGANTWSINWLVGRVAFDDAAAKGADFATAKTQGRFVKWNWNLARQQTLGPNDALYLSLGGQSTNSNLDASEKMLVGGPNSVRAYDIGAISADSGSFESIEYRHIFDNSETGYWTAIFFVDHEHVTINKKPWVNGINTDNLTGAGAGINWVGLDHWIAKAFIATPVGAIPISVGASRSTLVWVDLSKGF